MLWRNIKNISIVCFVNQDFYPIRLLRAKEDSQSLQHKLILLFNDWHFFKDVSNNRNRNRTKDTEYKKKYFGNFKISTMARNTRT